MIRKVEEKVINFIKEHELVKEGDNLLIALSGGPDSVFALSFFIKYSGKYKCLLHAVHFNHHLRGKESDRDRDFAVSLCDKLKVPLAVVDLDVKEYAKKNKLSVEEAARNLRYEKLFELSKKLNAKIVTAHNKNDNTETVLLNLIAGTGISGISGIPVKRNNIIRPFLVLTKDEILSYLASRNIGFRIDSTNLKNDYRRNYIRNKIIPLFKKINPSLDEAVFRTSKTIENYSGFLEKEIEQIAETFLAVKQNKLSVKTSAFKNVDAALLNDAIRKAVKSIWKVELDFSDLKSISKLTQTGKSIELRNRLCAIKQRGCVTIYKPEETGDVKVYLSPGSSVKIFELTIGITPVDKTKVRYRKTGKVEYISGDNLSENFIVRKWKPGDKFIPLGMKTPKKISDFLTDSKVAPVDRKNQLVLTNGNYIVWVVGLRIDERFKISTNTRKIFKLWMK
ncbi:Putative cell cycle control ATPase [Melioribacter roseus P3M-2]|uniref:tRNA(Ile)-lysidine synthase n=1 Tax=Melioribacter roseus (strain DSM 23840 / JCM 17771 / VKM B-2668 / P3M-2) TaxID=1191523 RepID=I7A129_MELRP|nr:tRNA lysidine(34) synthetase TilS [Melioribacter roseus]AFN73681.1 Putative cell cycle control ATPase [Melioribacter roseus P3M-2]